MINPMDLSGKTILITGASDGIGKSTSIFLSQLGAKVIMIARNEEKLQNVMDLLDGKDHRWYSYDLKNIEGIEDLIKTLVADNGKFDGFVHSAGISNVRPLKLTSFEFIHNVMLINFYSFIEIVRCISKKGSYNEGMSIVGMSSSSSIRGFKAKTAYCSSKAAMDGAIRAMSKELSEKKIRINSIIATFIKTDMFERFKERFAKTEDDLIFNKYILGIGETSDISSSIAFLLSNCSRIITGTGLVVDSGETS